MHVTLVISALAATTAALGINCRGSGTCPIASGDLKAIQFLVNGADNNRRYYSGQQIACTNNAGSSTPAPGGLCAFMQSGASATGAQVKGYIQDLVNHGCKKCGSVPTDGRDVNNGQLTVNYVGNPCGWKLC